MRSSENPPGMVIGHTPLPLSLPVPRDSTQAEIWFHNFSQTPTRCDAWDSQFGRNYWFGIGGPPPRGLREHRIPHDRHRETKRKDQARCWQNAQRRPTPVIVIVKSAHTPPRRPPTFARVNPSPGAVKKRLRGVNSEVVSSE